MNRLKNCRLTKGLKQSDVAAHLNIATNSYSQWETGKREPDYKSLVALADFFGVSVDYLLGRSDSSEPSDLTSVPGIYPIKRKRFPLLGEIACGEPTFQEEHHETYVESTDDIDADFCLRAVGESMSGSQINNGDLVFIKQMPMVENGDIAAILIENETTLKRVDYNHENGILILWPDNPSFRPQIYQGDDLNRIRILGRAVMIQKIIRRR